MGWFIGGFLKFCLGRSGLFIEGIRGFFEVGGVKLEVCGGVDRWGGWVLG